MNASDAHAAVELSDALGHYAECEEHESTQIVVFAGNAYSELPVYSSTVMILGNRFHRYDTAMAYLQALGVRDET